MIGLLDAESKREDPDATNEMRTAMVIRDKKGGSTEKKNDEIAEIQKPELPEETKGFNIRHDNANYEPFYEFKNQQTEELKSIHGSQDNKRETEIMMVNASSLPSN